MDHKPSLSCLNIYTPLSKSRLAHCVHAITACSSSSNISPALEFKGKNLCASRKCWTSLACSWSNWVSILTVRLRRRSPNWSSLRLFWKCEWHFTWKTNTHTYHHSSPSCHLSHQQISRLSHTHKQTSLPWRRSLPLGLSLTALSFLPSSIPLSHPPILPFFTHLFSQKGIQLEWQSVRTLSLLTCKGWGFTGLLFFSQPRLCVQNIWKIFLMFCTLTVNLISIKIHSFVAINVRHIHSQMSLIISLCFCVCKSACVCVWCYFVCMLSSPPISYTLNLLMSSFLPPQICILVIWWHCTLHRSTLKIIRKTGTVKFARKAPFKLLAV